jgi:2-hydroxycyclohexanecarboxyl-CoA dehydrogenase
VNGFGGRVAIVTGAAQGIGRAVCERLTSEGARVAAVDLNEEGGQQAVRDGVAATFVRCNVGDPDQVEAATGQVMTSLGSPTILVNNAGWDVIGPFLDSDESTWIDLLKVNLLGALYFSKRVAPLMQAAGGGAIVNVASDAGRVGSTGEVLYSGAKGGIIAATKSLAREFARMGIRVNCISPGPTDTPFFRRVTEGNPNLMKALVRGVPLGRPAASAEVANAIAFLASDEASFVTGQTLSVSGGLTMVS